MVRSGHVWRCQVDGGGGGGGGGGYRQRISKPNAEVIFHCHASGRSQINQVSTYEVDGMLSILYIAHHCSKGAEINSSY